MFIVSNFINNRREKLRSWKSARDKFANSDKCEYDSHLTRWDREHPKPVKEWGDVMWPLAWGTLIAIMVGAFVGLIVVLVANHDNPKSKTDKDKTAQSVKKEEPKKEEPKDDKCKEFKKGSFVIIKYGDMSGVTGTIVGGCERGEPYQIRLSKDAKKDLPSDGKEGEVNVGGWVIPVGSDNVEEIDKP